MPFTPTITDESPLAEVRGQLAEAAEYTRGLQALPANPTRLPRSRSDGLGVNLPRVAVSTGRIDAMECVFEKLGLAAMTTEEPARVAAE